MADLTAHDALQQPLASKHPVEIEKAILPVKPLAKIQAYKKKSKTPTKDIQLTPEIVQLEGEIETFQHEFLDLKDQISMLEANKHTWEEGK